MNSSNSFEAPARPERAPNQARRRALGVARARQAWTITRIELRRAFFAKRSLWVYGLALLPSVIFFGHGVDVKLRAERLARRGLTTPAMMDSIREGETAEDVKKRIHDLVEIPRLVEKTLELDGQIVPGLLIERQDDGVLGFEVVVGESSGDTGARRNLAHRGFGEAALAKQVQS